MSSLIKVTTVKVKPVMSTSMPEAQRRVRNLFKAWYRAVPVILRKYDCPVEPADVKRKIRENFMMNAGVRDMRAIDLLVVKGKIELDEALKMFKSTPQIMAYFKDSQREKPKDFLSKFLDGH